MEIPRMFGLLKFLIIISIVFIALDKLFTQPNYLFAWISATVLTSREQQDYNYIIPSLKFNANFLVMTIIHFKT